MDGVLKGQITAGGKCKQSFNGTNASFSLPVCQLHHYDRQRRQHQWALFRKPNRPYLATNDSGLYYVVYE